MPQFDLMRRFAAATWWRRRPAAAETGGPPRRVPRRSYCVARPLFFLSVSRVTPASSPMLLCGGTLADALAALFLAPGNPCVAASSPLRHHHPSPHAV